MHLLTTFVRWLASPEHVRWNADRGDKLPTDDLELPSIDQGSRAAEDDERLAIHLAQEASNATTLDDARYANLKRPYRWGASAKVSEFSGVSAEAPRRVEQGWATASGCGGFG